MSETIATGSTSVVFPSEGYQVLSTLVHLLGCSVLSFCFARRLEWSSLSKYAAVHQCSIHQMNTNSKTLHLSGSAQWPSSLTLGSLSFPVESSSAASACLSIMPLASQGSTSVSFCEHHFLRYRFKNTNLTPRTVAMGPVKC
jgi:hypothetical protein